MVRWCTTEFWLWVLRCSLLSRLQFTEVRQLWCVSWGKPMSIPCTNSSLWHFINLFLKSNQYSHTATLVLRQQHYHIFHVGLVLLLSSLLLWGVVGWLLEQWGTEFLFGWFLRLCWINYKHIVHIQNTQLSIWKGIWLLGEKITKEIHTWLRGQAKTICKHHLWNVWMCHLTCLTWCSAISALTSSISWGITSLSFSVSVVSAHCNQDSKASSNSWLAISPARAPASLCWCCLAHAKTLIKEPMHEYVHIWNSFQMY